MEQFVEGFGLSGLENRRELPHRNLLDLPNEMLINIMEYLPASSICKLRQTCSKLYQISHTQAIMKKLNFVMKNECDIDDLLELLNKIELRYLNLNFVNVELSQKHEILVNFLNSHGSKIDSITLDRCLVQNEILNIVMNRCCCLKQLIFNYSMVYDSESRIISKNTNNTNKTLKVLKFYESLNNADTQDLMISLLSFYTEIETFEFYGKRCDISDMAKFIVNKISCCNKSIKNFKLDLRYDDCWTALLESNIRLEELNKLNICCSRQNDFSVKNLQILLRRSPQLRTLKLLRIHSEINYNHFIDTINKYGNSLKILSYKGHINRTNAEDPLYTEERYVLTYLKNEKFILKSSGRICFKFVQNSCLTHISLHPISFNITSNLLQLISVSQNSLVSLKLYIHDDPINEKPVDYRISQLNLKLEKLEVLKIQVFDFSLRCIFIKSVFITMLFNDFNFPRLKVLSLTSNHCILIEKKDLTKMATGCPNLKNLRFSCRLHEKPDMLRLCENIRSLEQFQVIQSHHDVIYSYMHNMFCSHCLGWCN